MMKYKGRQDSCSLIVIYQNETQQVLNFLLLPSLFCTIPKTLEFGSPLHMVSVKVTIQPATKYFMGMFYKRSVLPLDMFDSIRTVDPEVMVCTR